MTEFVDKYIMPLVLGGGSVVVLSLVFLPILLRYVGKLKRVILGKDSELSLRDSIIVARDTEIAKLNGIKETIDILQNDLNEIKQKQDYSEAVTSGILSLKQGLLDVIINILIAPASNMQSRVADMQRETSTMHDLVERMRQCMIVTWGSSINYGATIKSILAEPVSSTVLYKRELEITKLKDLVRDKYGADAEVLLMGVMADVDKGVTR